VTEQDQNNLVNDKQLEDISKVFQQLGLDKSLDLNSLMSSVPSMLKNNSSLTNNSSNIANYARLLEGVPIMQLVEKITGTKKTTSNKNQNQQIDQLKAEIEKLKRQNLKLNGSLQDVMKELRRRYY
jgi:hypothetical protein